MRVRIEPHTKLVAIDLSLQRRVVQLHCVRWEAQISPIDFRRRSGDTSGGSRCATASVARVRGGPAEEKSVFRALRRFL